MTILLVKGPNVEKQSAWKITDGSKGNWTKKKKEKIIICDTCMIPVKLQSILFPLKIPNF